MKPRSRAGIDLQGVEGDSTKPTVEIGGKQDIEALPQPVIMERGAFEAGLEEGEQDGYRESPGAGPPLHGHTKGHAQGAGGQQVS
jgi:hypothetical protein